MVLGMNELLVVLVIVALIFTPKLIKQLPEIGKSIGKFKKEYRDTQK